jgi:hypothetical protein
LKKTFTKIRLVEWLKVKALSSSPSLSLSHTHTHTHTHTQNKKTQIGKKKTEKDGHASSYTANRGLISD